MLQFIQQEFRDEDVQQFMLCSNCWASLKLSNKVKAVSYTHLDVYKRQLLGSKNKLFSLSFLSPKLLVPICNIKYWDCVKPRVGITNM